MKNKTILFLFIVFVLIFQTACSGIMATTQAPIPTQDVNSMVSTSVALTQAAKPVVILPTDTTAPVVPPTTAPLVLPTTAPVVLVSGVVNYGANCRTGPGANFPVVVVLLQGAKVDIVGKANATDGLPWWQVRSSGQPDCWLINEALAITGDTGGVVVVVSPPTPTPAPLPSWNGSWTYWMSGGFDGAVDSSGTINFSQSGNTVSASFFNWDMQFTLTGTVSADGMTVNGTLNRVPAGTWTVVLKRVPGNVNQFRGSWMVLGMTEWDGAWCGATSGASKPSPCKTH